MYNDDFEKHSFFKSDWFLPSLFAVIAIIALIFLIFTYRDLYSGDNEDDLSTISGYSRAGASAAVNRENVMTRPSDDEIAAYEAEHVDPEVASFADGFIFDGYESAEKLPEVSETGEGILSKHVFLVNLDTNQVICRRDARKRIPPASMTKILTLLVAKEHIDDLSVKTTIDRDICNYTYGNGCSIVGFDIDEKPTMKDLLYGTILPSGADAVLGLCNVVADGQDNFVKLMNSKCEELGISDTAHFVNATGIYDETHLCTVEDMAVILKAALYDAACREVLDARKYTTSKTKQHPDGILISNKFLRRIEDLDMPGEVHGAKTGFVNQSGNCAASYFISDSGEHYICVTANAPGSWKCIYDHANLYNMYCR